MWSYWGNNNMIHENTEFAPSCATSLPRSDIALLGGKPANEEQSNLWVWDQDSFSSSKLVDPQNGCRNTRYDQMSGAFVTFLSCSQITGPAMLHLVPLKCPLQCFKLVRQWMCSLGSPGKCTLKMCQLLWRISSSVWWLVLLQEFSPNSWALSFAKEPCGWHILQNSTTKTDF